MSVFLGAVVLVRGALVQGACTGHRVLPSANVPRPAASSFISLRGAPDALCTMGAAVVLADQRLLCTTLPSMGCLAQRNQGGGRRPEDIRGARYPVGGSAPRTTTIAGFHLDRDLGPPKGRLLDELGGQVVARRNRCVLRLLA